MIAEPHLVQRKNRRAGLLQNSALCGDVPSARVGRRECQHGAFERAHPTRRATPRDIHLPDLCAAEIDMIGQPARPSASRGAGRSGWSFRDRPALSAESQLDPLNFDGIDLPRAVEDSEQVQIGPHLIDLQLGKKRGCRALRLKAIGEHSAPAEAHRREARLGFERLRRGAGNHRAEAVAAKKGIEPCGAGKETDDEQHQSGRHQPDGDFFP